MFTAPTRYHPLMAEDKQLTKNIKASEVWCKHCGEHGMKDEFVALLQEFRDFVDAPILITSGYRCKKHPVEASKKPGSVGRHTLGVAADITCPSMSLEQLYSRVKEFGKFQGVGVSRPKNFIHCDTRPAPARWYYSSSNKTLPWDGNWSSLKA